MSAVLQNHPPAEPRETLRQALAARDRIVATMAEATRHRDETAEAERAAQSTLDALAESETMGWALWAEDHSRAQPIEAPRQRAELVALRHAAARAADAAAGAYAEAEQVATRDLPLAGAAVASAARQVVLAEAERLGGRYAANVEAAQRTEAALQGLKQHFADRCDGDAVAAVVVALLGNRSIADAERRRAGLRHESAAIRESWKRLGERLLADPDATEDLT